MSTTIDPNSPLKIPPFIPLALTLAGGFYLLIAILVNGLHLH